MRNSPVRSQTKPWLLDLFPMPAATHAREHVNTAAHRVSGVDPSAGAGCWPDLTWMASTLFLLVSDI